MSARGEGAGQPSTSAQGQPAAPAPQKRGRGRPRKQQQVSTPARRDHSAHPRRLCPGAPRQAGRPERGSAATRAVQGCPPAPGCRWTGDRFPHRRVRSGRSRLPAPHGCRRRGSSSLLSHPAGGGVARGAYRDFRYCAQSRSGAAWLGDNEFLGSHRLKSIALSAALQPFIERACRGLGRSGGSGLGGSEAPRLSADSPGCLTAGGWRTAAAPSVPSPHSMAQGSHPPDKEREPTACLGSLNACGAATAGAGGEGSPGISDPRATGKRASPKELWKECPREVHGSYGCFPA